MVDNKGHTQAVNDNKRTDNDKDDTQSSYSDVSSISRFSEHIARGIRLRDQNTKKLYNHFRLTPSVKARPASVKSPQTSGNKTTTSTATGGPTPVGSKASSPGSSYRQTRFVSPPSSNTSQLVDDHGNEDESDDEDMFDEAIKVASEINRFPYSLTERELESQLEKKFKILATVVLPPFQPTDEESFEDWVDEAAAISTRHALGVSLFQEAWIAVTRPGFAARIRNIRPPATHELLVDAVAHKMGYKGQYLRKLELEVCKLKRQPTVIDAQILAENRLARTYRLSKRWKRAFIISNHRLKELALSALPSKIVSSYQFSDKLKTLPWENLWEKALDKEIWKQEESEANLANEEALYGDKRSRGEMETGQTSSPSNASSSSSPKGNLPLTPCPACGKEGHWKKDCKFKNYQCRNCHRVGHIAAACRALVHKDQAGRVETRVEIKPSVTTTSTRKDHTKLDKAVTAQTNLNQIVTEQKTKKKKEAIKRAKKKENQPSKRTKVTDRQQLHAESSASEESVQENSSGDEEELVDNKNRSFDGHVACVADSSSCVVRAPVKLNGQDHVAIMDSGAARSLCSLNKAAELQYKPAVDQKKIRFKGLANLTGTPTEPIQLSIGNRSTAIQMYMIDKPDLPLVIGSSDLVKLNLDVSMKHNIVRDADSHEIVERGLISEEGITELDRVTQKPADATDSELLELGKQTIRDKTKHLTTQQTDQIMKIFVKYKDVWLKPKAAQANKHTAKFEVEGPPIKMKMRPLAPELLKELDRQIDDMLKNGVISPSKSDWGGVPIFAKKRDGTWRLCLDFRKLNQRMVADIYPLPLLWSQVQRAAGHKYYTTLDLNWGFWNLPLHEDSRKYTALVTHRGLFEFNIIPFGIKNSPAEFQRLMDLTFGHLQHENIIWYIDDIILFANTISEMLTLLSKVLKVMLESGLYIKLVKTTLFHDHALALGHVVNQFGLRPNPQKVQGIKDSKIPTDLSELRGFLGSVNFLRKYIPYCADLQEPLVELLRKNVKFEMTEHRINAFEALKKAISDQTLLAAPRGSKGFTIYCDASDFGLGAVLLQEQDEELVPLEFASKSLSSAERNWPTFEKEAFAIRWAVAKFEDYIKIYGATIYTDQKSLQWMLSHEHGKVKRWSLYLQQFPLTIKHISGKDNVIADWLSRSMDADDPFDDENATLIPQFVATADVSADPMPASEKYLLSQNSIIPHLPSLADIRKASEEESNGKEFTKEVFKGDDNLYYHLKTAKLYIPQILRHHFTYWMHTSKNGAHAGINRTSSRLSQWVWWPKLKTSVSKYIDGCLLCLRHRPIFKSSTVSGVLSKPFPNELISLDVVGPRQWMSHKQYYICIIDHCTRFVVLHPLTTPPTAADIIHTLKSKWFPIFQMPFAILTDRGTEFTAKKFVEFIVNEVGAAIVRTSPYYPQGNAINESSHSAINNAITLLNKSGVTEFDECLQLAATIHNCSPHRSTGFTPFFLMFGFEATLPGWQSIQRQSKDLPTRVLLRKEEQVRNVYRKLLTSESEVFKPVDINVDDWIVFQISDYQKSRESDASIKYSARWSLPAKVLQIKDKQATVRSWEGKKIDVPMSKVFKLRGEVHPSLQPLNIQQLSIVQRPRFGISLRPSLPPSSWNEFLVDHQANPPTDPPISTSRKKRKAADI